MGSVEFLYLYFLLVDFKRFGQLFVLKCQLVDFGSELMNDLLQGILVLDAFASFSFHLLVMFLELIRVKTENVLVPILKFGKLALLVLYLTVFDLDLLLVSLTLVLQLLSMVL